MELSMFVCHHNVFNWRYRHVVFEKVRPAEKANHFESKGCCLMPASLFKLKNFKGKFPDTKKHSAARIKEGITFLLSLSENHHRTYVLVPLSVIQQKNGQPLLCIALSCQIVAMNVFSAICASLRWEPTLEFWIVCHWNNFNEKVDPLFRESFRTPIGTHLQ